VNLSGLLPAIEQLAPFEAMLAHLQAASSTSPRPAGAAALGLLRAARPALVAALAARWPAPVFVLVARNERALAVRDDLAAWNPQARVLNFAEPATLFYEPLPWGPRTIRERLATRVVYQSRFVQEWWQRTNGVGPGKHTVIYNGVDLEQFSPRGEGTVPQDRIRVLMVEGSLQGGYELGMQSAVRLAEALQAELGKNVELAVAGKADEALKSKWAQTSRVPIEWLGVVPNEHIPALNRGAHFLFSADLNAACPNSVIEALACGLPVLAFDTGALSELVTPEAGRVVAYGGDPWKLDPPNIQGLGSGAIEIIKAQAAFRRGSRARAEAAFGLDTMVDAYIQALGGANG